MATNGMGLTSRWLSLDTGRFTHSPCFGRLCRNHMAYLEILQEAERREGDHCIYGSYPVHGEQMPGYRFLADIGASAATLKSNWLNEYRGCWRESLLPGFESTSHFGSHIRGYSRDRPVSLIEATLLQLGFRRSLKSAAHPDTRYVTEHMKCSRSGGTGIAAHANGPQRDHRRRCYGTTGSRASLRPSIVAVCAEICQLLHRPRKVHFPKGFYNGKTEHYERRCSVSRAPTHRLRRTSAGGGNAWHKHGIGDRYVEFRCRTTGRA